MLIVNPPILVPQSAGAKQAEIAYKALYKRISKIKSLRVTLTMTRKGHVIFVTKFEVKRPNLSRAVDVIPDEKATLINVGDGQVEWFLTDDHQFIKHPASPNAVRSVPDGFDQFSSPDKIIWEFLDYRKTLFDGKPVNEIDVKYPGDNPLRLGLYVSGETGLPVGYQLTSTENKRVNIVHYTDVVVDQPIAPSEFVMKLPEDAKPYVADTTSKLLPVGSVAPGFTVTQLDGTKVDLSEVAKTHKAVLLNFWFCACGPCQRELPELQADYERLKSQGFELLTVNIQDSNADIAAFQKKRNLKLPVIGDQSSKVNLQDKYGVMACPTNYVIGPDGKIAAVFVGYDKPGITKALAGLGVKE